ncbi:MAG TPA: helix-turn-helix transcriptional regulator [Rhizomicrobium sp.]|jgi:transcriptional regulator with XRE-family HTH domain|nr:helix-turn-helix transcriptional regulator [Rhizomicrobium sp.]
MTIQPSHVGEHLKDWRRRRRMSQLDLACEAQISTRHLSFLETGRARPSREMILNLAEQLQIPARERNVLLVAAGYAPIFPERSLADPALDAARRAIDLVLGALLPYPGFALDRHWNVVATNRAIPELYAGVAGELLEPPSNAMRLSLHPKGLAPRIANFREWRAHALLRLRQQVELTADPALVDLLSEVSGYAIPQGGIVHPIPPQASEFVVPFQIMTQAGLLAFFTTTTVFGTPLDVTLSELAIESFFPADARTAETVTRLAEQRKPAHVGA